MEIKHASQDNRGKFRLRSSESLKRLECKRLFLIRGLISGNRLRLVQEEEFKEVERKILEQQQKQAEEEKAKKEKEEKEKLEKQQQEEEQRRIEEEKERKKKLK